MTIVRVCSNIFREFLRLVRYYETRRLLTFRKVPPSTCSIRLPHRRRRDVKRSNGNNIELTGIERDNATGIMSTTLLIVGSLWRHKSESSWYDMYLPTTLTYRCRSRIIALKARTVLSKVRDDKEAFAQWIKLVENDTRKKLIARYRISPRRKFHQLFRAMRIRPVRSIFM